MPALVLQINCMVHFTRTLPFRLILAPGQRLCVDMTRCDLLLTRYDTMRPVQCLQKMFTRA